MKLRAVKIWKCECGNQDQSRIITASDGEVVCGKCGIVLGAVVPKRSEKSEDQIDTWDGQLDLCRNLLEERVSRKGWQS